MIEVERKFLPPADGLDNLLEGFTASPTKTNDDKYFDTADYALTARNWWLRVRNGKFELKIAQNQQQNGFPTDVFDELETDEEIYTALNIEKTDAGIAADLTAAGYAPFAHLATERTKYSNGTMIIDIDHVVSLLNDVTPFSYDLLEIEVMVETEAEVAAAQEKIYAFAAARGLVTGYTPGKVLAYLKQCCPEQYSVLRDNGIAP